MLLYDVMLRRPLCLLDISLKWVLMTYRFVRYLQELMSYNMRIGGSK